MLVVSRKEHESILIEPVEGLDPSLTLREVFAQGAILVKLVHVGHRRVRMAIEAPAALRVKRSDTAPLEPASSCDGAAAGLPATTAGL